MSHEYRHHTRAEGLSLLRAGKPADGGPLLGLPHADRWGDSNIGRSRGGRCSQFQPPPVTGARSNPERLRGALIWFWIGVLTIASAGVTFFLTCLGMVGATNAAAPAISGYSAETMTNIIFTVSGIAAVAVAALIIFAFRRWRRR